jgi:hypothetical protein
MCYYYLYYIKFHKECVNLPNGCAEGVEKTVAEANARVVEDGRGRTGIKYHVVGGGDGIGGRTAPMACSWGHAHQRGAAAPHASRGGRVHHEEPWMEATEVAGRLWAGLIGETGNH